MQNNINKEVGFEQGDAFYLNVGRMREGRGGWWLQRVWLIRCEGVGRPLVILHTLIMLGYFFRQPHSSWGSLGKESTHWNGREVNRWISCDWELIDVRGNQTSSWCGNLRMNNPAQRNSGFSFMDCQIVIKIYIAEMYC